MSSVGNWRGPNIVNDGLILYIDPSSPNSYFNGVGNKIKDISGNGYLGTLINSPTFSSSNGGSLSFNGTNNYCSTDFTIPSLDNDSDFTWNVWCYPLSSSASPIIGNRGTSALPLNFIKLQTNSFQYVANNNFYDISYTLTVGSWNNVCITKEDTTLKYYHNSLLIGSSYPVTTIISLPFYIGGDPIANEYSNSKVGSIQLYNKSLSQSEVSQNFASLRDRFGI